MPTQRQHGGAQLVPINLTSPAFFGLNTEQAGSILGPEWATVLRNAVFDSSGRPSARKGWNTLTTVPAAGAIKRVFEYWQADTTSDVIFTTDNDILRNTGVPVSIAGSLTITDGNIMFGNFNNDVVAFGVGTGGIPAIYTGTGTFNDIVVNSGTAPTGNIGTAAFGRLWITDANRSTIRYSALLDSTRWDAADGGGVIDMHNIWPAGTDTIVAITEFGGDLIIFGENTTVIATDGAGASLGIDPTQLYVSDTIPGVGAISQFGITRAAGDLWVLTESGVVGLRREIVQRSTPTSNISKNVQSSLLEFLRLEQDVNDVTLVHSPVEDFVLAIFPTANRTVCFDTRFFLDDGTARVTTWSLPLRTAVYITDSQDLYGALDGTDGEVMRYAGNDDASSTYSFTYESGFLDLGEEAAIFLKFVKRLTSFVFIQTNTNVTHTLEYDFGADSFSDTRATTGSAPSEYNISEFGPNGSRDPGDGTLIAGIDTAEYSGGVVLRVIPVPTGGGGQYIKVGLTVDTNNAKFALQQINLFARIGRMAN